jgi:hypothetical protein
MRASRSQSLTHSAAYIGAYAAGTRPVALASASGALHRSAVPRGDARASDTAALQSMSRTLTNDDVDDWDDLTFSVPALRSIGLKRPSAGPMQTSMDWSATPVVAAAVAHGDATVAGIALASSADLGPLDALDVPLQETALNAGRASPAAATTVLWTAADGSHTVATSPAAHGAAATTTTVTTSATWELVDADEANEAVLLAEGGATAAAAAASDGARAPTGTGTATAAATEEPISPVGGAVALAATVAANAAATAAGLFTRFTDYLSPPTPGAGMSTGAPNAAWIPITSYVATATPSVRAQGPWDGAPPPPTHTHLTHAWRHGADDGHDVLPRAR